VIGERSKVAVLQRKVEQEPHHQRGTESLFRRIDPALDEERRSHAQRDVERRDETQIQPVRALEGDPLAERAANGVGRYKDPLAARHVRTAQPRKLIDEGIPRGWRQITTLPDRVRTCLVNLGQLGGPDNERPPRLGIAGLAPE